MRRPLFCFSAFFLAALAFFLLVEGSFGLLTAACAVLLFCTLLPGRFASHRGLLAAGALACLAAFGAAKGYRARMERWEPLAGQTAVFTGWVQEEDPYLPGRGTVWGSLQMEESGEETSSILLDIRGMGSDLTPGGWVSGRLLISEVRQNGDAFGGVSLYCIALGEAEDIAAPPGAHLLAELAAFRWSASQRIWDRYRDRPTAVVLAMVFSRQDLLPREVLEQMNRAGLRHLLVVSGLHLSIAAGWIMAGFRCFWREKREKDPGKGRGGGDGDRIGGPEEQTGTAGERIGALLSLMAVWLLAGLAGFSVSVLRAAVMSGLWLLGLVLGQRADSLTSLALAALLLAAASPPVLLQTGYQLSFLATLGVLLGSGPMAAGLFQRWESRFRKAGPLVRWVLEGFSVSICAQLGTLPVLAAAYGQFSVWGLLTTLPAMPFAAGIILLGGVGCMLFSGWNAALLQRLLLGAARGLARCILALAELTDRLPGGTVPVLLPYQLILCLLVPVAVFGYLRLRPWMRPGRARMLRRGAVLAAALVLLYHAAYYRDAVLVSASGDTGAVVISAPSGTLVLAQGEDAYYYRMVSSQLLRCGAKDPLALVCPWDSSANGILWWKTALSPVSVVAPEEETSLLQGQQPGLYLPLTQEPAEVLPGILVSHPSPEITCVEVSGRKVLKFWAGYGIIAANASFSSGEYVNAASGSVGDETGYACGIIAGKPLEGDLLIDMDGRVYPAFPELRPGRMLTGDANLLLPAW